jgi:CheY-like chemotaxis protein
MQDPQMRVGFMDIACPRCGETAEPAGHEDARAFFRCPSCDRVWATHIGVLGDSAAAARPPKVLIADDAPEMLGLLTAWLEDEGCVVIAVGSGREALSASVAYHPDVAFLDVVLPAPDGLQVCELLKGGPGPSVVLMTGLSNPDTARVSAAGALLLLRKPFSREIVVDALTLALDHHRRGESAVRAAS